MSEKQGKIRLVNDQEDSIWLLISRISRLNSYAPPITARRRLLTNCCGPVETDRS